MELHILFFIFAALLIAILVGFSIWSARREKSRIFSNTFSTRVSAPTATNDATPDLPPTLRQSQMPTPQDYQAMSVPEENPQEIQQEVESSLQNIKISLPSDAQAPQAEMPVQEESHTSTYGQRISNQQHIQHNMSELTQNETPAAVIIEEETVTANVEQPEQTVEDNDFVTLYIYAPQNEPFNGEFVVHHLESQGLRFGEHQIFHRHQHIDDSLSPIIFSAANLINPGTFDLHNIANFSTAGLVLFMQLPSEGSDIANMKLLINNAEHLAESLGGFLYDDAQQPFDDQSRQRYMQRVMH